MVAVHASQISLRDLSRHIEFFVSPLMWADVVFSRYGYSGMLVHYQARLNNQQFVFFEMFTF
jgi:hypothetical protein